MKDYTAIKTTEEDFQKGLRRLARKAILDTLQDGEIPDSEANKHLLIWAAEEMICLGTSVDVDPLYSGNDGTHMFEAHQEDFKRYYKEEFELALRVSATSLGATRRTLLDEEEGSLRSAWLVRVVVNDRNLIHVAYTGRAKFLSMRLSEECPIEGYYWDPPRKED